MTDSIYAPLANDQVRRRIGGMNQSEIKPSEENGKIADRMESLPNCDLSQLLMAAGRLAK
ncbi:MAG: hypothetical protein JXA42_12785 [Anaerolineales bacterium]|nr:hypothetical protein [Anaerolineales bacterium]